MKKVAENNNSNVFYRAPAKKYPLIKKAEGVYLYDTEGKKYLDGCSGCVVASIGYGVAEIADAMREAALQVSYAHGSTFSTGPQEELAKKIAALSPEGLDYVYFVSGGTEANETAISMALQYQKQKGRATKWKIIGRQLSYHGSSFGTMSVAGNTARRRLYSPLVMPFPLVPAPHCYRCFYQLSYPSCKVRCATVLEQVILAEGPDNIAAFIAEPIIGTSAGASVPPKEYFPLIREICDKYEVLFIADEVMSGYGRSGKFTAMEHFGVKPDIFTLGKGIAGGYTPLAAVVASEEVHRVFQEKWGKFHHGYTYQGNPVSCAVGLAVYRYMKKNRLFEQVEEKGNYLKSKLKEIAEGCQIVGDVRGRGLLLGLELVKDKKTRESFPGNLQLAEKVKDEAREKGLLLYTGVGASADTVSRDYLLIAPPFTITLEEMNKLLTLLSHSLQEVTTSLF